MAGSGLYGAVVGMDDIGRALLCVITGNEFPD